VQPFALALGSIAAAGWMRAEKIWVFAVVIAATLVMLGARQGARALGTAIPRAKRARVIAALVTAMLTSSAVVLVVNRATQTADYGWPPVTLNVRLFVRTAWPRLAGIRPLLSSDAQAVVSDADAERFDQNYNQYLTLVPRLQRSADGTNRLVDEISFTALRHRLPEIAVATAGDVVRYTFPMIAYPVDLATGRMGASNWTDSRMKMAFPTLTRIYLVAATVLLLVIQLPLLVLAVVRRSGRDRSIRFAAVLTVGAALANAVLYALGNGLQNVRYALPALMLVYATIVWSNAAVLALLWRGESPRAATGRQHLLADA
jgi:hypothetical protein